MGLATLDFAILTVTDEDLSMGRGTEKAGPTFATRLEQGNVWNGDRAMLTRLNNPADLAKLVVLDTLLLNWDRYAPAGRRINRENVFLSRERGGAGSTTVLAMDHTHVMLTSGRLAEQLCHIDRIKNEEVYGLFPAFAPYLTEFAVNQAVQSLGELTDDLIDGVLGEFPVEWEVQRLEQAAVRTFLMNRRSYLQETLFDRLSVEIGVQRAMMDQEED